MARPKVKLAWIEDLKARNIACQRRMNGLMKKVEELTILTGTSACLTFFNRDDGTLVAWPSKEEAKSLIQRFYALPENQRNLNAVDQESYIKTKTEKIEKKLEHSRKVVEELEMDHLMLQIQEGRKLVDLSQTETEKLMGYARKKMTDLKREIGGNNDPFLGDDDEDMESFEGESSKSGGADDA